MSTAFAIEVVAAVAVVSACTCAILRGYREAYRRERKLRSELMSEAEQRLARLVSAPRRCTY